MAAPYDTTQQYPPAAAPAPVGAQPAYPAAGAHAPDAGAPAHAPVAGTKSSGPIDDKDINDWKDRFNKTFANVGETVNAKSPAEAQEYQTAFFGCCSPIELCKCCLL
jgi:hypothetical protein